MSDLDGNDDAPAAAAEGSCPGRRFPLRRPENHKPPIARFSAVLPQTTKVAVLFLGLQSRDHNALRHALAGFLGHRSDQGIAPVYADHAAFTDPQGYLNHIVALYWLDARAYLAWLDLPDLVEWRKAVRATRLVGLWWEPIVVDAARMETITFQEFRRGFSGCPASGLETTDRSGYWGAARDRIPSAAHDIFEASVAGIDRRDAASVAHHWTVRPPKNMAVIRSGVSWEYCKGEQLEDYEERIKPKLDAGMSYLRDNPSETGCCSLRQVVCVTDDGTSLAEAYSLGAFLSMGHLESWAKDHPTHLAIYSRAMAARRKYQDQLQLRTYNEIFILDESNPAFEYCNCHPQTGLLPYAGLFGS